MIILKKLEAFEYISQTRENKVDLDHKNINKFPDSQVSDNDICRSFNEFCLRVNGMY